MAEKIKVLHTNSSLDNIQKISNTATPHKTALGFAYVSPYLDFAKTLEKLKNELGTLPLIAVTTSGELCAEKQGQPLYIAATPEYDSIVLQLFPDDLLQNFQILTIPLHNEDIRQGHFSMPAAKRVGMITQELKKQQLSFEIDVRDTVAFVLIDGLSSCENYFMEAVYLSDKFPCMFIGGSSGGKLDFKKSLIFANDRVLENHAVIILMKLAAGRSYSVLKSQNFRDEQIKLNIAEADTARRCVYATYDSKTGLKKPFAHHLAELLEVDVASLTDVLKKKTFAVMINDEYYVRSVSGINPATGTITFFCDVNEGEELVLVNAENFEQRTYQDVEKTLIQRPEPLGAILNDCILRRVNNNVDSANINSCWPMPVAGFSTFGEIFGINVNQTLSALVFYDTSQAPNAQDPLFAQFPLYYKNFCEYFSKRRNNAQKNLEEKEAQARKILNDEALTNIAKMGIITADENGIILSTNRAVFDIFGYTQEELAGNSVTLLMTESDSHSHSTYINSYLNSGNEKITEAGLEVLAKRKNGSTFPMHLNVSKTTEDQQIRFISICRDITSQKELEKTLQKEMAQAKDDSIAKSAFLARMSHELRTPLNGLLGMLQLLGDMHLNQEQQYLVSNALKSGQSLLDTVNDVLDISKIEAGAINLENIGMDLKEILLSISDILKLLATQKGLYLRCVIPDDLPAVVGDPVRIRQIFMNFIGNAIKYTSAGGVEAEIRILARSKADIHLRFEVRDTGIGISPDKLDLVFERFMQAELSTTRKYGGTGLGLAITKHLVTLMNGKIGVSSKENEGSCFWCEITMPITDSVYQARYNETELRKISNIPADQARVLVVEDSEMNTLVVKSALARFGIINATYVENGKLAVDAFEKTPFDVILMDCFMPEMNGYDATRAIRALEKEKLTHTPIIAMTANALAGEKEKCFLSGMDYYMAKPLNLAELRGLLEKWIDISAAVKAV